MQRNTYNTRRHISPLQNPITPTPPTNQCKRQPWHLTKVIGNDTDFVQFLCNSLEVSGFVGGLVAYEQTAQSGYTLWLKATGNSGYCIRRKIKKMNVYLTERLE